MIQLIIKNSLPNTVNISVGIISGTKRFFYHKYRKDSGHRFNANEYGWNIIPGQFGIYFAITF